MVTLVSVIYSCSHRKSSVTPLTLSTMIPRKVFLGEGTHVEMVKREVRVTRSRDVGFEQQPRWRQIR